jgi:mannose-1-phosphate guanylyltransferase
MEPTPRVPKIREPARSQWCIIVADDHGADCPLGFEHSPAPVQYCRLDAKASPLQHAIQRAAAFAPKSQLLVTAREQYRQFWQPAAWFIPPHHRFVSTCRHASQLAPAAAILAVAAISPTAIITVLPARCHVTNEWALRRAIHDALIALPEISEGAITLGMLDGEEGVDEDYLIVSRPRMGRGLRIEGFARQPVPWVARHLRRNGALVASGIMIGYASMFAAHIARNWPDLSAHLAARVAAAREAVEECSLSSLSNRGIAQTGTRSLRWQTPIFPQRVFSACRSGWNGLKSPRSTAQIIQSLFLSSGMMAGCARRPQVEGSESQSQMMLLPKTERTAAMQP